MIASRLLPLTLRSIPSHRQHRSLRSWMKSPLGDDRRRFDPSNKFAAELPEQAPPKGKKKNQHHHHHQRHHPQGRCPCISVAIIMSSQPTTAPGPVQDGEEKLSSSSSSQSSCRITSASPPTVGRLGCLPALTFALMCIGAPPPLAPAMRLDSFASEVFFNPMDLIRNNGINGMVQINSININPYYTKFLQPSPLPEPLRVSSMLSLSFRSPI